MRVFVHNYLQNFVKLSRQFHFRVLALGPGTREKSAQPCNEDKQTDDARLPASPVNVAQVPA